MLGSGAHLGQDMDWSISASTGIANPFSKVIAPIYLFLGILSISQRPDVGYICTVANIFS